MNKYKYITFISTGFIAAPLSSFSIQAGQYTTGIELLTKLAVLEEGQLGKRPDQMADIYYLLAKCKSEVNC